MRRESEEISASSKLKKAAKKFLFFLVPPFAPPQLVSALEAEALLRMWLKVKKQNYVLQNKHLIICQRVSHLRICAQYVLSRCSTTMWHQVLEKPYLRPNALIHSICPVSHQTFAMVALTVLFVVRNGLDCPRTLHPPCWLPQNQDDPIIRILDDSISTFRVHRRSFLRTARYNDDDPVEPEAHSSCQPRLCFNLIPLDVSKTPSPSNFWSCVHYPSPNAPYLSPGQNTHEHLTGSLSPWYKSKRAAYLCVRLAPLQAIDLVLVASPNGPHLRLLKQSIAQVVFSLRPVDRLAIVSYSSAAARIFPLRRMTTYGKKAALQVIDRLFYAGHADPVEGIRKGIKILKDRTHENPYSSILHLSDYPTSSRNYRTINDIEMGMPISVHQFHVASTSSVMQELEEFLGQLLGGVIQEVQLRIGDQEDGRIVKLGELRGDEERRVLLEVDKSHDHACIGYSYVEGEVRVDEQIRVGEVVVGISDPRDMDDGAEATVTAGRTSCVDSWEYHDPYMARRWAKRLHERHRI